MNLDLKKLSFSKESGCDFYKVLKKRITQYFEEKKVPVKANSSMLFKSFFFLGFSTIIYTLLLCNFFGPLGFIGLFGLFGFFTAIGIMNISHDALHGSYVTNKTMNRFLGYFMDLLGASSFYWKKEHTIDHHTYTNIADHDKDLEGSVFLRLCPDAPRKSYHRFQHWYAPFLYSLNLIHWIFVSDFKRFYKIFKSSENRPPLREIVGMFGFKALHFSLFLALPMLLGIVWWQVIVGYLVCQALAGLTITVIFQLAHIVEDVTFPLPNLEGKIDNSFFKHQLATTSNFATNSKVVSFLFGGLNFQIEHHIFPSICHIHLAKISPIVKATAEEFGLPYNENRSFFTAVRSHFRTLKRLGQSSYGT